MTEATGKGDTIKGTGVVRPITTIGTIERNIITRAGGESGLLHCKSGIAKSFNDAYPMAIPLIDLLALCPML